MYHMFILYRGLPFPSPVLDSETALGFWHAAPVETRDLGLESVTVTVTVTVRVCVVNWKTKKPSRRPVVSFYFWPLFQKAFKRTYQAVIMK